MKRIKKFLLYFLGIITSLFIILIIFNSTRKELDNTFLDEELSKVERYIKLRDLKDENISKASVAWHLDHLLITVDQIYKTVNKSDPNQYESSFNMVRMMMFTFNNIPRGRAQSPDNVKPPEIIQTDSIIHHLKKVRNLIEKFDSLPKDAYFEHPIIGKLNRKHTKRFLKVHTNHHLSIIEDILKSRQKTN